MLKLRNSCKSSSHPLRIECLLTCRFFRAAAAGGFIDRLVETKGVSNPSLPHPLGTPYSTFLPIQLDYVDKERAHHAGKFALAQSFRRYDPYSLAFPQ